MQQAKHYREQHGLNDPLPVQYFRWIGGIVTRGDFGHSFYYNKPVGEVVAERLPRTSLLALTCHFLASLLRHHLRHHRRHPAIHLGRHRALASSPSSA